jgi:glyoxylase-like metal-dependent hydrolase (beta-lactamase superfamily II)
MRKSLPMSAVLALLPAIGHMLLLAAAGSEAVPGKSSPGQVTAIQRLDVVEPGKPIPLSITNADGVKIAFQTKGSELQTKFTLHEASLGDVSHHRDAYRFTGDWPLAAGTYSWGGGDWTPCLYRADQFLPQDGKESGGFALIHDGVPRRSHLARFTRMTFQATRNEVRNLVIYRGDDTTPPEPPGQLAARADASTVQLAWKAARDNVGVAWYVISRAAENKPFAKIAQTANLTFTDKPPTAGTYRYRVLAADYERNMSPWSAAVSATVRADWAEPCLTSVAADALYYADHVRAVHDAGAGRMQKGFVYHYGDSINYLDRTQNRNRAILPLLPYALFNEIRNPNVDLSPVTTSATLLRDLKDPAKQILSLRPEFCLLTCGIEDLRANPPVARKTVVSNTLEMIKMFEAQGTVVIVATTNPYARTNPVGSPEEALSDALAKMCEENRVPVARVFDMYRNAARSGEDYGKLMSPVDTDTHGGAWPKGFGYAALWPSFEEGITRRLIVVKETMDRVLYTLLDRPDGGAARQVIAPPRRPVVAPVQSPAAAPVPRPTAVAAEPPAVKPARIETPRVALWKAHLEGRAPGLHLKKITEHLWVYPGPINVGIVRDGGKALLIDCGDGAVAARLDELGVKAVDRILFTHHHRDQACGAPALVAAGAKIGVPAAERGLFEQPLGWFDRRWVNWSYHPDYLLLTEPLKVDAAYADGQTLRWGPAEIRALATPGHTRGSMSYLVAVDGQRVAFSGDCIYAEGRAWELYGLTRAGMPYADGPGPCWGGNTEFEYEGFLWGRCELEKSLARIKAAGPAVLVPSHGRIMTDPPKALDALTTRLEQCWDKYVAINCLRGGIPDHFFNHVDFARKDCLPLFAKLSRQGNGKVYGEGPLWRERPVPACLSHRGPTSWLLRSKDGAAFLVDCGNGVEKELQQMVRKGELPGVECLWITHYHDDHCDGVAQFRKVFPSCTILADSHVADVISQPASWPPLPCLMAEPVRVDRVTHDGESWRWHEFRLTAYFFPSQTLYHGGLLAEKDDLRLFFAGDSFDWDGLEDYCPYNRNWQGPGVGYDRCLALIERLQPTHLLYAHSPRPFLFTPADLRLMRGNLGERQGLFTALLPWDDPNYGLDGWWIMCRPYEVHAKAGGRAAFDVVVMNHSSAPRTAACRAVPPRAWGAPPLLPASLADGADWPKTEIPAKTEGRVHLDVVVPAGTSPGRYAVPVDVRYGPRLLPQFTVALVHVDR